MTVIIDRSCTACGLCLLTCPTDALAAAPRRPRVIDDACTDCWLCIEVCPVDAITAVAADSRAPAVTSAAATWSMSRQVPADDATGDEPGTDQRPAGPTTAGGTTPWAGDGGHELGVRLTVAEVFGPDQDDDRRTPIAWGSMTPLATDSTTVVMPL
jgi:NAD-dependent dihydropyrimidine dehydrogenase PreA subunit